MARVSQTDAQSLGQVYSEALAAAEIVWETARTGGRPDTGAAQRLADQLADALCTNPAALVARTDAAEHGHDTFTHMVNVAILTMAQAYAIGIDGSELRQFGMAALTHDIGKIRTPVEILEKPGKLTDDEFAVMQRHTIDGASILEATPEMPGLAVSVALEHHLRLDGSGYPRMHSRPTRLVTMLCSIADVYDAMRSRHHYQPSYPPSQIFGVLTGHNGRRFDQSLVRRFAELLGVEPRHDRATAQAAARPS